MSRYERRLPPWAHSRCRIARETTARLEIGIFLGAWDEFRTECVDEYRELDGDRVLLLNRFGGRGKASGVEVGQMRAKAAVVPCAVG